jgi:hypothetical protein
MPSHISSPSSSGGVTVHVRSGMDIIPESNGLSDLETKKIRDFLNERDAAMVAAQQTSSAKACKWIKENQMEIVKFIVTFAVTFLVAFLAGYYTMTSKVNDATAQVNSLNLQVQNQQSISANIQSQLNALLPQVSSATASIASLNIIPLQNAIYTASSSVSGIQNNITTLQSAVSSASSTMANLQTSLSQNTITTLSTQVGIIQSQVINLNTTIAVSLLSNFNSQQNQLLSFNASLNNNIASLLFQLNQVSARSSRSISSIKTQVFIVSGTYTPTNGMVFAMIEVIGGGGGGGSVQGSGNEGAAAAGGGAGGYARAVISSITIGSSQTITIGTGGNGGSIPGCNHGSLGGTTSFGSLLTASGGGFGVCMSHNGATGGTPNEPPGCGGGGDLNTCGGFGGSGTEWVTVATGGIGGASVYSGGGRPATSGSGNSFSGGTSPGWGGGGGGAATTGGVDQPGGNGFSGVVIVMEYLAV